MRSHTKSLAVNSHSSTDIYLEVELRLDSAPSRPVNLTLALTFITDKRLLPVSKYQFQLRSPDGSGGGGAIVHNFSFRLADSFKQAKFSTFPLPLIVEPLVRWGLQPCSQIDEGECLGSVLFLVLDFFA